MRSLTLYNITELSPNEADGIDMSSQFAIAAYCERLLDTSTGNRVCANPDPSACGFVKNATTVLQFSTDNSIGGNIAVSKDPNVIVMSFKGTNPFSASDILTDLMVCLRKPRGLQETAISLISEAADASVCLAGSALTFPICPATDFLSRLGSNIVAFFSPASSDARPGTADTSLPLCDDCLLHSGFFAAFETMKDSMLSEITNQVAANPNATVIVTGHSLGGAVATIAGAYLRKNGIPCDLYTFGSPRVGNEAFANFVSGQDGRTFRITNQQDPVTVVPGMCSTGYAHTTPEIWFPDGRASPNTVETCTGTRHEQCSAQFRVDVTKAGDHSAKAYANGFNPCAIPEPRIGDIVAQDDIQALVDLGILDDTVAKAGTTVGDTLLTDTPVANTPVEETPVEETPVEETLVEETPVEESPVEETPVEETLVGDTPVEETPAAPVNANAGAAKRKV